MPHLRIDNISFSANANTLFDGVSFELPEGRSIAISGGSGKGKTTLLRIVMGLVKPSGGSVLINNTDATAQNAKMRTQLRREIFASAPQTPHIIPSLTAAENVALAFRLRTPSARIDPRFVFEALDQFRVLHLKDRYVDHLSGGEQRRIALARAFIGGPSIICLDEPTEALDYSLASEISQSIFNNSNKSNASLIIATHDPAIIERCNHHLDMNWVRLER